MERGPAKHGLRRVLGVSTILGAVLSASGAATPVLDVRTDRVAYQFGEPVWVYVWVQNPGDIPLAVENPHCSRTVTRLEIVGADGAVYPMTGPASCATTVLERIPPGSEMLYAFELLEFYGVDGGQEFPFGFLPPGVGVLFAGQSFGDHITLCATCCVDILPDYRRLEAYLQESLDELVALT